jgi:hypothetical protein
MNYKAAYIAGDSEEMIFQAKAVPEMETIILSTFHQRPDHIAQIPICHRA